VSERPGALDVSVLPAHAFGSRSLAWWATMGFIVIEGGMFAMTIATLLYLHGTVSRWPPPPFAPPLLLWGTLNTAILLASAWPNHCMRVAAERLDLGGIRRWILVADAFSLAFLAVRWLELQHLNVRWDDNAYGSVVWVLLGFHTFHLLTDAIESLVLTAMMFGAPGPRRYVDVSESGLYWYFVVLVWIPIYAVIYWLPRAW
jgi:heme/copper-type cytochrome/quinol oxidase subunit 3